MSHSVAHSALVGHGALYILYSAPWVGPCHFSFGCLNISDYMKFDIFYIFYHR